MASSSMRSTAGRIGAWSRWAKEPDRRKATEPARRGFRGRFERQVDPDGILPPDELAYRTDCAIKAHMSQLALTKAKKARAT